MIARSNHNQMPDCEPVRLWRERFKLNLSASWKADVEKTVTDLDLWKEILDGWFYVEHGKKKTKHPGIKNLLNEYERQKCNQQLQEVSANNAANSLSTRSGEGIPQGSGCYLPKVSSEAERLYFRVGDVVR
ncbi:MAG TPA: hypothetical protein VFX97_17085 [Pyrinomonadaceae bacterium]|nr:hypothetical protein [Pyrinomonadaceae bacterium]